MRRVCVGLALALVGCDPTAGLSDSADAALPQIKRYFDAPGSQLASGPWSRVVVDLDEDTLYHVGARRLDDKQPSFHLFGADAREGCTVTPNAGTWLMGKPTPAPFRVLPYLENIDQQGRGRLRFTTVDCQVQDLALENAGRPYPRLYDHGYLVPVGDGYTFADPWAGTTRSIAGALQGVLVWANVVLLWADDELKSFSDQFEAGSQWGNQIEAVVPFLNDFLVEDADGLHRVKLDRSSLELSAEDVLPDTCQLQHSSLISTNDKTAYVVAAQPCGATQPSLLQIDLKTSEVVSSQLLPFEADARHTRALVSPPVDGADPIPFTVLFLTNVDDGGLGTLWAWQDGADAPIQIGEQAELDAAYLDPTSSWAGVAQINYQVLGDYVAHDWVHFNWDGTTEPIAEHVVRNSASGDLIVNFDGVAGDLPAFSGDGYRVLAKGVPPYTAEATSYVGERHYALVDHFDGDAGRALLGQDSQDPTTWDSVGSGVPPEQLRFAWFMPALVFIENWDAEQRTGSLVAYNYELDARTTIAEGVSSFDLTSYPWDGVVYSVPRGKQRGIWFAKAK